MIKYTVNYYLNYLSNKGRIAWEYNPFRNLRRTKNTDQEGIHEDQIKYNGLLYDKYKEDGLKTYYKNNKNEIIIKNNDDYQLPNGTIITKEVQKYNSKNVIEAGSIVDLDTELLNFSLNNPVDIEIQNSYDGSVNLILNDGRNPPRMINSRFSPRGLNTYEIVDRIGDNDTNIYDDSNQFELDASLYKRYNKIPKVKFNNVLNSGYLKVGNYTLYFKYCDADDNETDFVAESGIISVFKGQDPFSIDGGIVNMNAHKSIDVTLTNIDDAYDYVKVYYTRASSDIEQNRQVGVYKILNNYIVSRNKCNIIINGDENVDIVPDTELNLQYFVANSAKAQAQCQNMLFLANLTKSDTLHQDLTDISLRILPYLKKHKAYNLIGKVDEDTYQDNSVSQDNYEYYNPRNIYYHVGYWNEEIYRFGIVYIMSDNTLSKVYNIRGCGELPNEDAYADYFYKGTSIFNDQGDRQFIEITEDTYQVIGGKPLENSKGVCRIVDSPDDEYVYSIGIAISDEIKNYLQNYCNIKGFFIVRQKRIPTILAQGFTIPIDNESRTPVIFNVNNGWFQERFIDNNRILTQDYSSRLYEKPSNASQQNNIAAILCPEFEVRQQLYNQFFTGSTYPISYIKNCSMVKSNLNNRIYIAKTQVNGYNRRTKAKLITCTENVPTVAIEDQIFKSVCGTAQEAFRYEYAFKEGERTKKDNNLLRGIWHPYIAALFVDKAQFGQIVNIYMAGYNTSEMANYFAIRYNDNSPYYPISDRLNLSELYVGDGTYYKIECFRGDCYICTFTHRLNRNFQDPTLPFNDDILDRECFKNYDPQDKESIDKVNLGDVNAIRIGSWYTFRVRSNTNLSIRSLDESWLEEKGMSGLSRGFYPLSQELDSGNNKISDSYLYNDGFRSNFGEKYYLRLQDVPHIKNNFENRVIYSDIAINDAFRNGYRVFRSTNFADYSKEYGSIIELVTMSSQGLQNGLLCVFEHAIGYIPVNERALAGQGAGGNVFVNTNKVLPDNPRIINDMLGSQWKESIIQTPYYVYGVDTVAKKIWRTNGQKVEILSDFKVNKFLVDNISLSERETTPVIGIRNVKTHYNANKSDVMFTFYDNLYGLEEKVWNLCYNEITQSFVTFYSWVPSYSANIDNIFFSFDRDVSKAISKLGTSSASSTSADGVVLSSVVLDDNYCTIIQPTLINRLLPKNNCTLEYSLEKDPYGNHKYFQLGLIDNQYVIKFTGDPNNRKPQNIRLLNSKKVWYLYIKTSIYTSENGVKSNDLASDTLNYTYGYYNSIVAVTSQNALQNLKSDFWKHGQAGIIDIKDEIVPCHWYGKQHPFEFEFVVRDNPMLHKIFDNLEIISNKCEPESFHFEVVGESYDFTKDKKNMYYRQEATKEIWQRNGSNITYDHKYKDIKPSQNVKSTLFTLYYNRVDTYDDIYDSYMQAKGEKEKDYRNLSGSEIIRDKDLSEYRIRTHILNTPITNDIQHRRIRGNSHYKEDRWFVQIPSITFVQKNEDPWKDAPPIVFNYIPSDVTNDEINLGDNNIEYLSEWSSRKEARIKDKYMKVRIRYEGSELAIIQYILTFYTQSYA